MIILVGIVAFMFGAATGVLIGGVFTASSRADDLALLHHVLAERDKHDADGEIPW